MRTAALTEVFIDDAIDDGIQTAGNVDQDLGESIQRDEDVQLEVGAKRRLTSSLGVFHTIVSDRLHDVVGQLTNDVGQHRDQHGDCHLATVGGRTAFITWIDIIEQEAPQLVRQGKTLRKIEFDLKPSAGGIFDSCSP